MSIIIRTVMILFFGGALATSAIAQGKRMNKGERGHHMVKALDLTDDQQAKIEKMRLELKKDVLPLESQEGTLRSELGLLLTADNVAQSKVDAKIEEIGKIKVAIQKKEVSLKMRIRAMLNDTQRVKFDQHLLTGKLGGKRGHHRGSKH